MAKFVIQLQKRKKFNSLQLKFYRKTFLNK